MADAMEHAGVPNEMDALPEEVMGPLPISKMEVCCMAYAGIRYLGIGLQETQRGRLPHARESRVYAEEDAAHDQGHVGAKG